MTAATARASHAAHRTRTEASRVAHKAMRAAHNPWLERAARFGYVVKGALYLLMGGLAVAVATQRGGALTNPQGAIATVAGLPYGHVLLILVAIGLAAYGLWGLVRAIFDPLGRGHRPSGLADRLGYLISGCFYTSLVPFTIKLLMGAPSAGGDGGSGGSQPFTARLLAAPGGVWLLGAIGVAWLIMSGLGQIYEALTARFRCDLESWQMSHDQLESATLVGRIGFAARGVAFSIIGVFLIQAAVNHDAYRNTGLDGALAALAAQPPGPWLLGLVAAGLICFGAFSLCCARWIRV